MKRFKSVVMSALAVMVTIAMYAPMVSADSASLSITPKKNYVIEPGKSVKDTLTIRNPDKTDPLNLSLRVVDFTFTDDGGTPKLLLGEDIPQTTWSLKPFLTVPKTVTIGPGQSKTLDVNVAIPAGHGAGSYYSAIVYSSSGGSGNGNVGLSASGVTLVFTQIPGKVNEDLQLQKFGNYDQKTKKYKFITTNAPTAMGYMLKNNGNVTEAPVGQIVLKHMLVPGEITINKINANGSLVLLGQTRTFSACIVEPKEEKQEVAPTGSAKCETPFLWPGRYTASLNILYGQNGNPTKEIIKNVSFWYLPIWFIVLVLAVIAVAAFYIWRWRKNRGKKTTFRRRK